MNLAYNFKKDTISKSQLKNNKDSDLLNIKLFFWDTAGQEKFHFISQQYFKRSDVILLVYDVTNRNSFESLERWINDIEAYGPNDKVLLLGNKADLNYNREVTTEEGIAFAKEYGFQFFETSAKEDINVTEAVNL